MSPRFRPDIEGLRALAVGLVVLFHAGVPFVPGGFVGVDVFFVISGFLITGLLVDEVGRSGRISIVGFYARRARRLLPLSALVILVTLGASFLILPRLELATVGQAAIASALFVANWFFAASSGDYLAGDINGNPLLHYWSLGVEEQFYMVWPLLVMAAAWGGPWAARTGRPVIRRIAVLLAVVGIASFIASIVLTSTHASLAYFGTQTRAWELGAGAGLALARGVLPRLANSRLGPIAAWTGVALVVVSAARIDAASNFPGAIAAVPVLGTVLLLASGGRTALTPVTRVLRSRAAGYVGHISYSWYLWHWPVLVLTAAALAPGSPDGIHALPAWAVLPAVTLSFALASLSSTLIEAPVRDSAVLRTSVPKSLIMGAVLIATGVLAALPLATSGVAVGDVARADAPATARADVAAVDSACNISLVGTDAPPASACLGGDPHGTRTVVLLGDSHAAQWIPALDAAAKARHWKLYTWTKSRCPATAVTTWEPTSRASYDACTAWNASVAQRLAGLKGVDLVVLGRYFTYVNTLLDAQGNRAGAGAVPALWEAGSRSTFAALARPGTRVAVLQDTPYVGVDVPACLATSSAAHCAFPTAAGVGHDRVLTSAEKAVGAKGVRFVDMSGAICGTGSTCPVVGADGLIHFRDSNHLTASFARQLGPVLGAKLAALLPSRSAGH